MEQSKEQILNAAIDNHPFQGMGDEEYKMALQAMEEYAESRLHLLQQEYEALQRWKEEAKLLLNPIFEYAEMHPYMKIGGSMTEFVINRCKEYDKLKGHYNTVYDEHGKLITALEKLKPEHAALKEKADKMAEALSKNLEWIASTGIKNVAIDDKKGMALYSIKHLSQTALSSYNTNQKENNG
jgi:hypothetical protein